MERSEVTLDARVPDGLAECSSSTSKSQIRRDLLPFEFLLLSLPSRGLCHLTLAAKQTVPRSFRIGSRRAQTNNKRTQRYVTQEVYLRQTPRDNEQCSLGPTNAAKLLIMARIISVTREMIPHHLFERFRFRAWEGRRSYPVKR